MSTVIRPQRQHPIILLRHAARYGLLLILPVLRGDWASILGIGIFLALSVVAWWRHTYALTDKAFLHQYGVLYKRTTLFYRRSITTLSIEYPFLLRPLHIARMTADTDSHYTLRLVVRNRQAGEILAARKADMHRVLYHFRARNFSVAILSVFESNSFNGILLLAAAFYQSGRLFGESYRQTILDNVNSAATLIRFVPRITAIAGILLLIGWVIAAVRNLLRHLPFCITRHPRVLAIQTGAFTHRLHLCTVSAVNFVDYRQTLVCKALRLHMVFLHCIGYGKARNALALLIPISSIKHTDKEVQQLLPEFPRQPITHRPAKRSLPRYIRYPLCALATLYPFAHFIAPLFPLWCDTLISLTVLTIIPCLWWLTVTIIDRYTTGIGINDGMLTLRYVKQLTFHTVILPQDSIVLYRFRQSLFQKRKHTGDLILYTYATHKKSHRIRNLRVEDINTLIHKNTGKA